ncbi:hypothetical protein ANN_00865 [Periplaneta americana]|uniref:DDE Tnp4 domain-containing protein n=1 Tax=Periplaneta americana TaxID=6978 RepID=A0ABQ8TTN8_PERAM|nr:hypothetical protein ANN_00865 [Periplaneta americana]
MISEGTFPFPRPSALPGTDKSLQDATVLPHVIVGDEAFHLTTTMMRPYPNKQSRHNEEKRIFNIRHSRTRRTSENSFEIMSKYWRVFFTPIPVLMEVVDDLVMSAVFSTTFSGTKE